MGSPSLTVGREDLGADAVALLRELIAFETVNPPGNEAAQQQHVMDRLEAAGFECELLAREPGRENLIARLRGDADGPSVCLLSHADTVPADPARWRHDPWSGDVADGEIWGRGALDMKSQTAAEVAAACGLAERGWRPERGELLVVVTADEEAGGAYGARWLCEAHPDRVRCDYVVNEGGGMRLDVDGRRLYPVALGEKGTFRFELVTRAMGGHASLPKGGSNALVAMLPWLQRIAEGQAPYERTPEGEALLDALLGQGALDGAGDEHGAVAAALDRLRAIEPWLADLLVEPMMGVTLVPTMIEASNKGNVIPSECVAYIDCRVPPGKGREHAEERVRAVLGAGDYELRFGDPVIGNASDADTELWGWIEAWLAGADPAGELVSGVMPGFSDSRWFRDAFGAVAYGFFPISEMGLVDAVPLIHAADERIPVADMHFATSFFADLIPRALGSAAHPTTEGDA